MTCYMAIVQDYEITDGHAIQRKVDRTLAKFPICKMVSPLIWFQKIEGGRFRIDIKWYVPEPVNDGELAA